MRKVRGAWDKIGNLLSFQGRDYKRPDLVHQPAGFQRLAGTDNPRELLF